MRVAAFPETDPGTGVVAIKWRRTRRTFHRHSHPRTSRMARLRDPRTRWLESITRGRGGRGRPRPAVPVFLTPPRLARDEAPRLPYLNTGRQIRTRRTGRIIVREYLRGEDPDRLTPQRAIEFADLAAEVDARAGAICCRGPSRQPQSDRRDRRGPFRPRTATEGHVAEKSRPGALSRPRSWATQAAYRASKNRRTEQPTTSRY